MRGTLPHVGIQLVDKVIVAWTWTWVSSFSNKTAETQKDGDQVLYSGTEDGQAWLFPSLLPAAGLGAWSGLVWLRANMRACLVLLLSFVGWVATLIQTKEGDRGRWIRTNEWAGDWDWTGLAWVEMEVCVVLCCVFFSGWFLFGFPRSIRHSRVWVSKLGCGSGPTWVVWPCVCG